MLNLKEDWWLHVIRSEIPQLEVVTAIADAESEDFVAQLLFSQGWNIIQRAFDAQSLLDFMADRGSELRTVIIYMSDLSGLQPGVIESMEGVTVSIISLDGIPINSHLLMTHIRNKLRSPMLRMDEVSAIVEPALKRDELIHSKIYSESEKFDSEKFGSQRFENRTGGRSQFKPNHRDSHQRLIAVTGTAGAPGRTRFSLLLAEEFANTQRVLLVDADIRSQGLARQRDQVRRPEIDLLSLDVEDRPTKLPEQAPMTIVDLGTMPAMAEAVADRRWHGSLVNNVLDSATHLVYVSKSTALSVNELSQFLREYPLLLKKVSVTYICVLSGHSRELRQWESKFLSLTTGENRHIIRENQLNPDGESSLIPFFKPGSAKRKEIGKIAISLR